MAYVQLLKHCKSCNIKTNHNHEVMFNLKHTAINIKLTCVSCEKYSTLYGNGSELLSEYKHSEIIFN
jgi:hypothetical protein